MMSQETTHRLGPRPLALHAFAAWRAYLLAASLPTSPIDRQLDLPLFQKLGASPQDRLALSAAILAETSNRWSGFLGGIGKYRAHPFHRPESHHKVVWRDGNTQLLDFAPDSNGKPIIAIPSLINSSDVLDLMPGRSLMQALADAGFRPFLISWGNPEVDAIDWSVDRYLSDRLIPILVHVSSLTSHNPFLMGYCMGGLLATALAAHRPSGISGLALLATPWNFHAPSPQVAASIAELAPWFSKASADTGAVPTDIIQTLFIALDPTLAARKFRHFSEIDQESDEAQLFVAMEDWVNGGPDLAWPVAHTVLEDWYGSNLTHEGFWRVSGKLVEAETFPGPILVAAPDNDRIVPPESSKAFANAAVNAECLSIPAGHVGMIVGSQSKTGLWRPLIDWLKHHS
jgi:polyhydroxyalkanoate synthase